MNKESGKVVADFGETERNLEQVVPQEIERKFLVRELPSNLEKYPHKDVVQGYIAVTADGTEVRLRQKGGKFYQTVKMGKGKTRSEMEIEITAGQFDVLWGATSGKRVEKTRFEIEHDGALIELDIYHGQLTGLLTAEVEFKDEKSSLDFVPPNWFGEEVTEDPGYKNQNLALKGRPEKAQ